MSNQSQNTQRGTSETPPVAQIQQPQSEQTRAAEAKKKGKWYSSPDWWMVGATFALVFVTGLLWIFTAAMWWISRKQFVAANRPKLEIRFLRRLNNPRIAVEFRVENVGGGTAHVKRSEILLDFFSSGVLPQPDDIHGEDVLGRVTLDAGAGWRFIANRNELTSLIQIYEQGQQFLHLVGWIVYEDAIGRQATYFCRRYVLINDRWSRVTETDYEQSREKDAT